MPPLDDGKIERILAVVAHADDIEFGAGGTVARWTERGIAVSYYILTNGEQGCRDPAVAREQIPAIRAGEQREAGRRLGVSDIQFLEMPDGRLEPTLPLRKHIVRAIRQVRPHRLLIQSPERDWDHVFASHPDHLAAGEAAMQAVYPDAGNPRAFEDLLKEEGLEAWAVREVWVMGGPRADHCVDITETFDRKIAALRAHVSQVAHMTRLEANVRDWGEHHARSNGLPDGRVAEVFKVITTAWEPG